MSDSEEEPAQEEAEEEEEKKVHFAPGEKTEASPQLGAPHGRKLLEDAKKCKEVALGAYKVENFKKATEMWKSSHEQLKLIMAEKLFSEDDPEYAEVSSLQVAVCSNLAQAQLKDGSFHQALESCETVLAQEPQNAKAVYRKAQAQIMASDFAGARSTANEWLKFDPDNADARQLLNKIARQEKVSKAATKQTAKRMFDRLEHDPRTVNPPPREQKDEDDDWIDEEESGLKKNSDGSYTLEEGRPRSAFSDEDWRNLFHTIYSWCTCRKRKAD